METKSGAEPTVNAAAAAAAIGLRGRAAARAVSAIVPPIVTTTLRSRLNSIEPINRPPGTKN